MGCGINDSTIEGEYWVVLLKEELGYLTYIGIQTNAEEGSLPLNVLK